LEQKGDFKRPGKPKGIDEANGRGNLRLCSAILEIPVALVGREVAELGSRGVVYGLRPCGKASE